jgi:hypothetical protein
VKNKLVGVSGWVGGFFLLFFFKDVMVFVWCSCRVRTRGVGVGVGV